MYKKILPTAMATENVANKADQDDGMTKTLPQNIAAAPLAVNIQKPVEVIVSSPDGEERFKKHPEPDAALSAQEKLEVPVHNTQAVSDTPIDPQVQAAAVSAEPPLVNLMEAFVEKRLDAALKKFKCCTCEKCRRDVLTIALNKLPPLYVVEDDPDIRDLHERERAAQVATALVQAILAVKAHPPHEINH